MRKGLDRQTVIEAALRLVDEEGIGAFSMTALAKALNVKTASLYNHVDDIGDLLSEVSGRAVDLINGVTEEAMRGKRRQDALKALAFAHWDYAKKHPGLYHLSVRGTMDGSIKEVRAESMRVLDPINAAICQYELTREQKVHWHRIIRSVGYGFMIHMLENAFTLEEFSAELTYETIIDGIHRALCALEEKNRSGNNGSDKTIE